MKVLNKINWLLEKGATIHSWDDRYSKGIWVIIAPPNVSNIMLESIYDASDAGDLDMIPATDYYLSTNWLPIEIGNDLFDGLQKLENRLQFVTDENYFKWSKKIEGVIEQFEEISKNAGYGELVGKLPVLNKEWQDS